jgi:RES domain
MAATRTSLLPLSQAIADYLASHAALDGIIYPSAQVAGAKKNIVLFHHASRVKPLELPTNVELEARTYTSTEDGPEADYWVSEELPESDAQAQLTKENGRPSIFSIAAPEVGDANVRDVTLHLDLESVQEHHVEAVSFQTTAHKVRRHRWTKGDLVF